jgi:hypothetical protein
VGGVPQGRCWSCGEGRVVCVRDVIILNQLWMQNKIYIFVGALLGRNILFITYCLYRHWLRAISSTFCRRLKLEKCVIH